MDPWNVIGWILLSAIVLGVAFFGVGELLIGFSRAILWWRHRATRDIPPAPGQVWLRPTDSGDLEPLEIRSVYEDGSVFVAGRFSGCVDTADTWHKRVREDRLMLSPVRTKEPTKL